MARRPGRLATLLAGAAIAAAQISACTTPPQVVQISPDRDAQQVPSNADVVIQFDRAVDEGSVASHFMVSPNAAGIVTWPARNKLVFRHQAFRASTNYRVQLRGGYRDAAGTVNTLNHGWSFTTEAPPRLLGASPAPAEQNVDPAGDLALTFSRPMDLTSLQSALAITPSIGYRLTTDPGDGRRVIVAPSTLLDASTSYSVTVTPDARDVDGNPLAAGVALDFTTGPLRALRHWVTFDASQGALTNGIWVVDERRLPRQLTSTPAIGFSWSQDGMHLLAQGDSGVWSDVAVDAGATQLPFSASWAAFLAPGDGYVYLDDNGRLNRLTAEGVTVPIDSGVAQAAVAAGGGHLAYVVRGAAGTSEIRGYDVELRSHYRLQSEPGSVDALAWAPDDTHLAYRLETNDPSRLAIRVRDLGGSGGVITVGLGQVSAPAWQADSRHVVLSAEVTSPSGVLPRAFRLSATAPATRPLVYDDAIPSPPNVGVRNPQPSPDGHQLAFLAPSEGGDQVWVMNADGTGLAQVTRFDARSFPYSCAALTWTRS